MNQENHKQSEYWLLRPRSTQLTLNKDNVAHRSERVEKVPDWVLACLLVRAMPRVLSPIHRDQNRIEADDHNLLNKDRMAHSYKAIHQWFENHPVHIVNKSQKLGPEQQLLAELSAKHIPATISEILQPKQLTILIVHPKDSYKEAPETDPYQVLRAEYPEAVIQSCYPESLIGKGRDSVVDVLLKELLVIFEVRHRQLQLDYPTFPSNAWFIHPVKSSFLSLFGGVRLSHQNQLAFG